MKLLMGICIPWGFDDTPHGHGGNNTSGISPSASKIVGFNYKDSGAKVVCDGNIWG